MPIRKVQFTPEEFYHIFNRGNARQEIFHTDKDRYRFLQAMYLANTSNSVMGVGDLDRNKSGYTLLDIKKLLDKKDIAYDPLVRICADVLMPNHFHFLVQEIKEGGTVEFMHRLGVSYGKYFTIKNDKPGSLFQGRFQAKHIETDEQLCYLLAYINVINPAQLAEPNLKENGIENFDRVWEFVNNYKWSSHFEYMGKRSSILIDKGLLGEIYPNSDTYEQFVKDILSSKIRKFWTWMASDKAIFD
jgi:putative transposase